MKLSAVCMHCKPKGFTGYITLPTVKLDINDNGTYKFSCPFGHDSFVILQQQRFEILFDIGAFAIIDGYYREAISSFTSSLERFYEFFIKVICISKKIELKDIDDTWNKVSSQSERQLGAFIFIYLQEFGKKPDLLSDKNIKFRNSVIHKGKIPNKEEAIQYGNDILNLIRPLLETIKENYKDALGKIIGEHVSKLHKLSADPYTSLMCIPTILNLTIMDEEYHKRNLQEIISNMHHY